MADIVNPQPNLIENAPPPAKKSPMEMIKMGFAQIGAKAQGMFGKKTSTTLNVVPEQGAAPVTSKPNKLVFIAGGVGVLLIILLIVAVVFRNRIGTRGPIQIVSSSPTPVAVSFTPAPNKYAADGDVIKLTEDVNSFDSELSTINIEESNLKPRPYLWDINFK